MHLIDELMPYIANNNISMPSSVGPLTTTFLLAMAAPMINLPVERMFKQTGQDSNAIADDTQLNSNLTIEVRTMIGGTKFKNTPFYEKDAWSFAAPPAGSVNIANGLSSNLCEELSEPQAFTCAARLQTSQLVMCLRNALAHGGIAYLDESGFPGLTHVPAKMLAFVSEKRMRTTDGDGKTILTTVKYNVLRIDEERFLSFLRKWSCWLESSGLAEQLAA